MRGLYFIEHGLAETQADDLRQALQESLAPTGLQGYEANAGVNSSTPLLDACQRIFLSGIGIYDLSAHTPDSYLQIGISAEVIDPRTTNPLDKDTLINSAKKTSRAIVIDEGYERYGVTAEIASVIAHGAFYFLDAPVTRMGAMDVPVPFSPVLEDLTVPTEESVAATAKYLCGKL